jgi:fused signal recognition particle receptor
MFTFFKNLFSRKWDYEELERTLYEGDLGAELSTEIVEKIRKLPQDEALPFIKEHLLKLFPPPPPLKTGSPHVILLIGVNGSGKTTTLAKLAQKYRSQNKQVLIAAADTFRAAAAEQLETWAIRTHSSLVKGQPKSDPAAVVFDALQAALARKSDVVLIDTAGRLQNKTDLMHELAKIHRTIQKILPNAPHETLLVLDATIGQNAIDQAKTFHATCPITGVVLTKLDGTAKGGIAAALQKQTSLPILWIGKGEGADDLAPFDPHEYVKSLFE